MSYTTKLDDQEIIDFINTHFHNVASTLVVRILTQLNGGGDSPITYDQLQEFLRWLDDNNVNPETDRVPEYNPEPEPEVDQNEDAIPHIQVGPYILDSSGEDIPLYADCFTNAYLDGSGNIVFMAEDTLGQDAYAKLDISAFLGALNRARVRAGRTEIVIK